MTADIVERLQYYASTSPTKAKLCAEAAAEIVALRRQLEEAREALAQCEGALKAGGFEQGFAAEASRNWREKYQP